MEANSDVFITVHPGLETDGLVQFEAELRVGLVTVVEVVVVVEPEGSSSLSLPDLPDGQYPGPPR